MPTRGSFIVNSQGVQPADLLAARELGRDLMLSNGGTLSGRSNPLPPPSVTPAMNPPSWPSVPPPSFIVSSNGITQTAVAASSSGFSLSMIPWWGWAAAGLGAFFFFGGGRGHR